jgi:hypothetical protein
MRRSLVPDSSNLSVRKAYVTLVDSFADQSGIQEIRRAIITTTFEF